MPDVEITVRGTATTTHPPEFATVHLAASAQGSERGEVHERAEAAAKAITAAIAPLVDENDGPITQWASEQLRVDSYRDFNGRKDREVLMHRAEVSFRVRFGGTDAGTGGFARLGAWLGTAIAVDDVEVRHTEWELSDSTRERLTEQVRSEAVRSAQQRAAGYARDLGLTAVRPVAAADPGLLGRSVEHGGAVPLAGARAPRFSASSGMNVNFVPEDIEVHAAVDMRFLAG
ncbi:MAG TPA: SIMPL domain-containing protein [Jatrophihabitantaceae bacterium]|jgi:uncharacterized protein YggE|nr:SIMPL domain-containing protein [Jatrophihabitantaceae bacterium]